MHPPLLKAINVWYRYPSGVEALKGVTVEVFQGKVTAVMGPNGSGKTTLLLVCGGLLKPREGDVFFMGKRLQDQLPHIRKEIGIVFQDPDDQIFNLTVYDEIAFTLKQLKNSEEEIRKRVMEVADLLNVKHLLNRSPYKLSHGEKKRITLASALVLEPKLLILDEPTMNVSPKLIDDLIEIIKDLKKKNTGILVASHSVEFVSEISDLVCILNNGEVLASSNKKDILLNDELLEKAELWSLSKIYSKLRNIIEEIKNNH